MLAKIRALHSMRNWKMANKLKVFNQRMEKLYDTNAFWVGVVFTLLFLSYPMFINPESPQFSILHYILTPIMLVTALHAYSFLRHRPYK